MSCVRFKPGRAFLEELNRGLLRSAICLECNLAQAAEIGAQRIRMASCHWQAHCSRRSFCFWAMCCGAGCEDQHLALLRRHAVIASCHAFPQCWPESRKVCCLQLKVTVVTDGDRGDIVICRDFHDV